MRILIFTYGTRGDFQPYVALGAALRQAGHEVILPAPEAFESLISEAGLSFHKARGGNPLEIIRQPAVRSAMRSGGNLLRWLLVILRQVGPLLEANFETCWECSQEADAIIAGTLPWGALDCAEKRGLPGLWATLGPLQPTRAFPYTFLPLFGVRFNTRRNLLSYWIGRQLFWHVFRIPLNQWRERRLGLPAVPFGGPYRQLNARQTPMLYALSENVLPKPTDWPAWHHLTGYWFLDEPAGWQAPADLLRFLEAGPAPVYFGFGSMDDQNPERMTSIVMEALRLSSQRGVLLSGWVGLGKNSLPDTVYHADSLPHSWLFPRMAAVVHHGGANTTAAGLRAGIPTVITPVLGDQFFWAGCIKRLGVGIYPGTFAKITAEKLAEAITQAVTNPEVRDRAQTISRAIRAENGLSRAVDIIQRYLVGFPHGSRKTAASFA